jgi:hypothetical protein
MGRSAMENSNTDDTAHLGWDPESGNWRALADEARPQLGSEGFSDERIDELAEAFATSRIGETTEQFVNWAMTQGPIGLDPEAGF